MIAAFSIAAPLHVLRLYTAGRGDLARYESPLGLGKSFGLHESGSADLTAFESVFLGIVIIPMEPLSIGLNAYGYKQTKCAGLPNF